MKIFKKNISFFELLLDTISCFLLSSGLVLAVYPQISPNYTLGSIFLYSLVITVMLSAASLLGWRSLAVLGGTLVLATILLLLFNKFTDVITYISGFMNWLFTGMLPESEYNVAQSYTIMQVGLCIGVCLIVFVFVRILHSVYPLDIAAFIIVGIYTLYGITANNLTIAILMAAGSLPVISTNFYSKRKSLKAIFKRKKPDTITPGWTVQAVAAVVCILGIVVSSMVLPTDTMALRRRFATNITADLQTATNIYSVRQKDFKQTNLHALGLQPRMRLGGNLEFESDEVVAIVESEHNEKILLKAIVLDNWDGTMWTASFDTAYRYDSPYFTDAQTTVFDDNVSSDKAINSILTEIYTPKSATVTLIKPSPLLLMPSGATSIKEDTPLIDPIMYNYLSEVFAFTELPEGYTYTVNYNDFQLNYARIATLPLFTSLIKDPMADNTEFIQKYTALPENFPKSVINHAQKLTDGLKSDYEMVAEMTRYLSDSSVFVYTNTPGALPNNTDLSVHLLRTRSGSSVYYANCLAVMARSLGIPSRVVGGYYAETWNEQFSCFSATESDAFAWVECYIKNVGWVTFNPSPINPPTVEEEVIEGEDGVPEAKPEYEPLPEEPFEEEQQDEPKPEKTFELNALITILLVLAAILIVILIRSLFTKWMYSYEHATRTFKRNTKKICEYYFYDIRNQLRLLKIKRKPTETLMEQLQKATSLDCYDSLERSFKVIETLRYSSINTIDAYYAEQLHSTHLLLEDILKTSTSRFMYLLMRRILRPGKCCFIISTNIYSVYLKLHTSYQKFKVAVLNKISDIKLQIDKRKYS